MPRPLRVLAGLIFASVPIVIYLFYIGFLGPDLIYPSVVILLSVALLYYFSRIHEAEKDSNQLVHVIGVLLLVFVGSSLWLILQLFTEEVAFITYSEPTLPSIPESFLPQWWLLIFLAPATIALAFSSLRAKEFPDYSSPGSLEMLPQSPVFFGSISGFIGFWGVLFVGLGLIHRIVIVAPIFEELLKFGVALLFAAAIFGRSIMARYAVAIIIGVVFGMVEHTITYPGETDLTYLFRVIFHSVTTGLSITIYTVFEEGDENRLMWVAPAISILLHFSYNTFSVVVAILLFSLDETVLSALQIGFGSIMIIATLFVTILALLRSEPIFEIHRAITAFLPDHEA